MKTRKPGGLRLRVIVQKRDKGAARGGDSLVIRRAKATIFAVANHPGAEAFRGHFGRAVGGAVVDNDGFVGHAGLTRK